MAAHSLFNAFKRRFTVGATRAVCRLHPVWLPLSSDRHGSELFNSWEWFGWIMSADYEFLVCGPQLLVMNQSATQGDFWSRAHFCIMRSKVVQINGVSILMGPGKMAGWWILFALSSPIFFLPDLHQGEPKGSHWKVTAPPFDRCWHKNPGCVHLLFVADLSPSERDTLSKRHGKPFKVRMSEAPLLHKL